jgi:two-component system sensor histidine kinase KdpD
MRPTVTAPRRPCQSLKNRSIISDTLVPFAEGAPRVAYDAVMMLEWRFDRRQVAVAAATVLLSLAATSLLIAGLHDRLGMTNVSAVYLLAVVIVAIRFGRVAGVATALGAFLLFDFLFVEPRYTFAVADAAEWLNLVLLLVVGVVVGQLAALQRTRADSAEVREREARVMFQVSRALATRSQTEVALQSIVDTLRDATHVSRVRIVLGADSAAERVTTDTEPGASFPRPAGYFVLKRTAADEPTRWIRVRDPATRAIRKSAGSDGHPVPDNEMWRVNIEAGGRALGALWSVRPRDARQPSLEETRMFAAAADQIGQALEQDHLRAEATSAELARQSDALKTALLDSVSHDLRTPLASIRAAAGSLMDPDLPWTADERRESARTIDLEAERLNRLVTNLLDMSRIEAGGLRAEVEPYPLDELLHTALYRIRPVTAGRNITVAIPPDLPPVMVDPTFMDQILTNVIENAVKYIPPKAAIRITASRQDDRYARLVVEDGGPGVPPDALSRIFEKFYRVRRQGEGARRGTGVGLAVVRGLVQTMGGGISARRSQLGGLAIDINLPLAPSPDEAPRTPAPAGAAR